MRARRVAKYLSSFIILLICSCVSHRGYYHRVQRGETLYRIAKAYEVPIDEIGRANNLRDYGALREGQYILIPDTDEKEAAETTVGGPPQQPRPKQPKKVGKKRFSEENVRRTIPKRLRASNLQGRFIWPVSAPQYQRVVRPFGEWNRQRHTGIDLVAGLGTPVLAVASGKVIYTGEKVMGFGKTIIIRHDEEIFSVYSHLDGILVKAGDSVAKGQRLAAVGAPDEIHFGLRTPFLHFELRERTIPLDPENLLP